MAQNAHFYFLDEGGGEVGEEERSHHIPIHVFP